MGKAKAKAKTKAKTKTKTKTAGKSTSDAPAKTKLGPAWTLTSSEAQKRRYMAIEAVRSIHPSAGTRVLNLVCVSLQEVFSLADQVAAAKRKLRTVGQDIR